jgi:hypothetical protein
MGTLTLVVTDQSGAFIPGARVLAKALGKDASYEVTTDATGKAVVHLDQGSYKLKVQASAFKTWEEKEVEVNAELLLTATLVIAPSCGPYVTTSPYDVNKILLLEHQAPSDAIPLLPLQQFLPPAKPLHHKRHWFCF